MSPLFSLENKKIKTEQPEPSFYCEYCGNPFRTEDTLDRHKKKCKDNPSNINKTISIEFDEIQLNELKFLMESCENKYRNKSEIHTQHSILFKNTFTNKLKELKGIEDK